MPSAPHSPSPQYAAGLSLQAWVDQHSWKDAVSVGVGIDNEGGPCLHLYVQTKNHALALRPRVEDLPKTWEDFQVVHHRVGPMVAQAS